MKKLECVKKGDHVFFLVDSIGQISSKKEVDDANDEKSVADMSRAKAIRSLLRLVTVQLSIKEIPCFMINHVYSEIGMFPKTVIPGGCVYKGTKILMADGSLIEIENIKEGDSVQTLLGNKEVTATWNPETLFDGTPGCYEITFEDGHTVGCSETHPFLTSVGWVQAKDLTAEHEGICIDESVKRITDVEYSGHVEVYDISVQDAEQYVLENGVVTHNTAVTYCANQIFVITKSQDKASDGELDGWKFTINIFKSRFVREKAKLPFTVHYDTGIQQYSGMLDIAIDLGGVVKPSNGWYSRVDSETGEVEPKKFRAKDTNRYEFWKPLLTSELFKEKVKAYYIIGGTGSIMQSDINDGETGDDENDE